MVGGPVLLVTDALRVRPRRRRTRVRPLSRSGRLAGSLEIILRGTLRGRMVLASVSLSQAQLA
jgi:hypothetical protein